MKLAFLTHEPFHPPSGGGSAEAMYLVRELVRRGHEVRLFCPEFPDAARVARDFAVQVHPFTAWRMGRYARLRNLKYLLYPSFLERLVLREAAGAGLEMVVSQHAIAAVTAGRLKRRLGVPVVMNYLDYLTGFMETWPRYVAPRAVIRALERFEISLPVRYAADGVMTVSDPLADHFERAGYPRERLQPIYYGYDAQCFRPAPETAVPAGAPVVVMHGSFDQHHLGPIALEALRTVHRRRPEVRFRFVGRETPTLRRFCQRVRTVAPALPIECTGFVPYAQVADRLATAAVGIVPYEASTGVHCAFVAKIVEYLGVGLPVVSTALEGAQRYFSREPAAWFTGFDGRQFGEAILGWLERPGAERRALARKAGARVAAALDWSVICSRAAGFIEAVHRRHCDAG